MFNFRNKMKKKYRGNNIYLARIEDIDTEKFLSILFSMVEGYTKQEQKMPQKIVLSKNNYDRIMNYNRKLIIREDDKEYMLCVELEVERNSKRR